MRNFRSLVLGLVLVSLAGVSWSAENFGLREQARGYAKLKVGMDLGKVGDLMGPYQYLYEPNRNARLYHWCANTFAGSKSYAVLVLSHGGVSFKSELEKRRYYCDRQVAVWQAEVPKHTKGDAIYRWHPDTDVYNIDKLKIRITRDYNYQCLDEKKLVAINLEGEIGPDSSFAMEKILGRETSCQTVDGDNDFLVSLSSGGGLLEHGYKLGEIFRKFGVSTMVLPGDECASSCAIAFLGGKRRGVGYSGKLLFHSPYYKGLNSKGESVMACAADQETLDKLLWYYESMIGKKEGQTLLERTMSYCSSSDGWVLTGNAAAELYGITQALGADLKN